MRYLYCRIRRDRLGVFEGAFVWSNVRDMLEKIGANIMVEPDYIHFEIPFEDREALAKKLEPILPTLQNWENRKIISCLVLEKPVLPPKPPVELTPEEVEEKISKYARAIWSGLRKIPWGKIATILGKSIAIGVKHLTGAAKEITQMVIEEVKKKPEKEQVPLLVTINSLIEARRKGEITEEEFIETMRAIARQL